MASRTGPKSVAGLVAAMLAVGGCGSASHDAASSAHGGSLNSGGATAAGGNTTTSSSGAGGSAVGCTMGGTVGSSATWWKPTVDVPVHWHWQLSQEFQVPRDVLANKHIFDVDGEQSTAETVAALHALQPDVKVICYFDAGVYEDYRSDASSFPSSVIGNPDIGWDGSYWLDVRQLDVILPILKTRVVNWCLNKGFDAVEPDETEVYDNDPGFPITRADNLVFNRAVADMVHSLGLSVGLKGNNSDAPELEPYFDWALTEQCWEFDECALFRDSFVAKGKMVLNVEYAAAPNCTSANQWHINSSRRDLDLVGPTATAYLYAPCVPDTQDHW